MASMSPMDSLLILWYSLCAWENSVGIFFVAAVIAEQKIEEIFPSFLSRDGRQRVVRRVRLRDDAYALVRIVQPFPEHLFREGDDCPFILSLQQNDTVVPIGKDSPSRPRRERRVRAPSEP